MSHCSGIDPFVTLMGKVGPIPRKDIVSRKGHASRNKKIKDVIKVVCICKSGGKYEGAPHTPLFQMA